MKLEQLRLVWRLMALGLTMAVAASSNLAMADDWRLELWGQHPAQAALLPSEECGGAQGERALRFDRSAGDGAELVYGKQALQPGNSYETVVRLKTVAPGSDLLVDVSWRKDGPYYETSVIKTVRVASNEWQDVVLRGHYTSIAPGALRLNVRSAPGALCVGRTELREVALPASFAWQSVSNVFFGIHLNKLGRHNAWPRFDPDVLRMWSTATTWAELQPVRGDIDWRGNIHAQRLDYFVQHVTKQSGPHQMIMTLGMTPSWAADSRLDGSACDQSPWGKGSCLPPVDLEIWRAHVRQLAERYRDSPIRIWELWNEADVSTHWVGGADGMVKLAAVAREELRKVSADNQLIGPNVTSLGIRFLHDFLQAGGGRHVDGLSVHVYMGRDSERAYAILDNVKTMLADQGLTYPIWNTETNTACGGGPLADRLLEQAACRTPALDVLAQSVLLHAAQGIRNFTFYTWEGAELDVGGIGLVEPDFQTVTPAGDVMMRLRALLSGARVQFVPSDVVGLRQVEVEADRRRCRVYWTRGGEPIRVTPAGGARVKQLDGSDVMAAMDGSVLASSMPQVACVGGLPW